MSYRLVTSHVKEELARMREDERKRAKDAKRSKGDRRHVATRPRCPTCGLRMISVHDWDRHLVYYFCGECGILG